THKNRPLDSHRTGLTLSRLAIEPPRVIQRPRCPAPLPSRKRRPNYKLLRTRHGLLKTATLEQRYNFHDHLIVQITDIPAWENHLLKPDNVDRCRNTMTCVPAAMRVCRTIDPDPPGPLIIEP